MSNYWASEGAKILLLVAAFATLYWFSRWASRLNESSTQPLPMQLPDPPPASAQAEYPRTNIVPIDRRPQFRSSEPIDEEQLRPVHIVQLYFSQFDFESGPPDPSSFSDELFVKLYDENSGYDWTQSFFVATPRGLDEMLQRESWDYAYTDRVFFVRKYDPKIIRQAVVEQLLSTQEKPSPPKEPDRDAYV